MFVVTLIMSLVAPVGTANATSTYDDIVLPVPSLQTRCLFSGTGQIDQSLIWRESFTDGNIDNDTYVQDAINFHNANTSDSGWGVMQGTLNGNFDDTLWIVVYDSSEVSPKFHTFTNGSTFDGFGFEGAVDGVNFWQVIVYDYGQYGIPCGTMYTGRGGPFYMSDNGGYYSPISPLKWYLLADDVSYPTGYEGMLIPSTFTPQAPTYVAMGDSFSSGEGNPAFEEGTDTYGINQCHRSQSAYPRLLQSDSSLNLGSTAFVACSGATTNSVLYGGSSAGSWGEGPQIDSLSEDTEVVTITIGGNDVGFRDFAVACTAGICNFSTTAYSTIVDKINNDLPSSLEDVFDAIADRVSSTAEVYVIGYPQIAPPAMPTGFNSICWPLNGQLDNPDAGLNDGATVRDVQTRLNNAISAGVATFDDERFTYIDPNLSGSPFIDHDWCKEDSYFDIVTHNNVEYSFHPNVDGQGAYATIVKDAMN